MKNIVSFLRKYSLSILGALALAVAVGGVQITSFFTSYQPECPKELLK
ncbi:MAG: cyclic lactone autoinducer peptide [Clostridiaceae bacterium]|nr:cyclic lactone autoinducer peptide [Clostridiaceae bacterium]